MALPFPRKRRVTALAVLGRSCERPVACAAGYHALLFAMDRWSRVGSCRCSAGGGRGVGHRGGVLSAGALGGSPVRGGEALSTTEQVSWR
jgi:hypothetical protein